jgi:DNA-binding transcriptional LysR family regulator
MDWTNRLRLRQLQVLGSLIETQNISHSAQRLNLTQPALSKWLKELEVDLGLPLFERHARGLRPTAYARTLNEYASRVGNELDRARDEMTALQQGSSGRAVIGASGAAIASTVPHAVLATLAKMPKASIEIVEGPMDRLFQQLARREIDIAVGRLYTDHRNPEIASESLYDEQLLFAVRLKHPLATIKNLTWPDLLSQRWVVWPRALPVRGVLETALCKAGLAVPSDSVQSNSLIATIALVAESDMVAVVAERAIEVFERRKTLTRLPIKLKTQSAVMAYWRRDEPMSATVASLLQSLRQVDNSLG